MRNDIFEAATNIKGKPVGQNLQGSYRDAIRGTHQWKLVPEKPLTVPQPQR